MAYLDWDIDTSLFSVCSLTTLPSHYGDFMPQPWHRHVAMGSYTLIIYRVWERMEQSGRERAKGELKNQNAIGGVAGGISYLRREK